MNCNYRPGEMSACTLNWPGKQDSDGYVQQCTEHSTAVDPDYWYHHRHDLEPGQVFRLSDGSIVKLDRRVPGDGTKWYVADWNLYWSYCDNQIEPGELRGDPIKDPGFATKSVTQASTASNRN